MSSNYPGGFATGVVIRGVPIDVPNPGEVFWVNNSSVLAKGARAGSNGNDGTYRSPFSTIDYAIGKCTADRGDVIYVMPGHSETVGAANDIDFDVAGITVIGLGFGSKQAQIRFTAAAASITIDAADITWFGLRLTAAFEDVAAAVDLNAGSDGFSAINCLFDEEQANENYVIIFDAVNGANNLSFIGNEVYFQDIAAEEFLQLGGTHDVVRIIDNNFQRDTVQTSVKAFVTSVTAVTRGTITGNTFSSLEPVAAASVIVLSGTANDGICNDNVMGWLDTNATNANCISAMDVTGMVMGRNEASGAIDECSNIFSRSTLTS